MSARFVVTEIEGYPIGVGGVKSSRLAISCSVLDSAYCYAEVGRFSSERVRGNGKTLKGGLFRMTHDETYEAARNRAHGLAAILETEHAA